jgi:hypothetical protein
MSLSGHGYKYEVALDGEVIVTSSRDPEFDACRELLRRGRRGIAVFRRSGAAPHFWVDVERGAQLMTKESAWGVRVVKFTAEGASTGEGSPQEQLDFAAAQLNFAGSCN